MISTTTYLIRPMPVKSKSTSLSMTDYWFLFGMWLVVFWAVDPFAGKMDLIAGIKHIPLFIIIPSFLLALVGVHLFPSKNEIVNRISEIDSLTVTILYFSALITIGSLVARLAFGVDNSFLTMGLFSLMAPLTYWFIMQSASPVRLVNTLVYIYLFWAFIAIAVQLLNFGISEIFHSKEHLVIAATSTLYFKAKSSSLKILSLFLIGLSAFIAHKNTAYLTALLTFVFIFLIWALPYSLKYKDPLHRYAFWISIIIVMAIAALAVFVFYYYKSSALPTGNPVYRLHTYEIAWNKFLDSPIWGTAFTGAATEKFGLYSVMSSTQILPTHSDPLDILANGGIIGFIIWTLIYFKLARMWFAIAKKPSKLLPSNLPFVHALFCIAFAGVLVCTFNPILNTPNLAWAYWAIIGSLLGLLRHSNMSEKIS